VEYAYRLGILIVVCNAFLLLLFAYVANKHAHLLKPKLVEEIDIIGLVI